jgi:hypoxanthine phosphoribosyltransferase
VADRLNAEFSTAVVVTVVPGGIQTTADLVRQPTFDIEMDYLSCPQTPGQRQNASPNVYQHRGVATGSASDPLWALWAAP